MEDEEIEPQPVEDIPVAAATELSLGQRVAELEARVSILEQDSTSTALIADDLDTRVDHIEAEHNTEESEQDYERDDTNDTSARDDHTGDESRGEEEARPETVNWFFRKRRFF
jgi:hypothetical protein